MRASPDRRPCPEGYGLTTAQILYRVPDFRNLVQEYLWQDYDLAPDYPELHRFLTAWKRNLEAALLSVTITQSKHTKPAPFRETGHFFLLN